MPKPSLALPAIVLLGLLEPAHAQIATDGSLGPRVDVPGPEFAIPADLGRQADRNLFHSFERFSLATGERATFSGPDQIRNVITRVTGGARSEIDGTLRSTIPGADFYFINPAGILFGPNSSLDLQGSFHVSTADEVRFRDGAKFSADLAAHSSFTVARPEAFGFLAPAPTPIQVDQSVLEVPFGKSFSLVGGDIEVVGGPTGFIAAEAGQITLAAVGGPGEARLDSGNVIGESDGGIRLTDQAFIDTSGAGGGAIRIEGGRLLVDDSVVFADNDGSGNATGGIDIEADRVTLRNGAQVTADALASGDGGQVRVDAIRVEIRSGSFLGSDVHASGNGGILDVEADALLISGDGAEDFTGMGTDVAPSGTGQGGRTMVHARDLRVLDGGQIGVSTFNEGHAGTIEIDAENIELRRGGSITSSTFGDGDAGPVEVHAHKVVIDGAGSLIASEVFSTGNAGEVNVTAGDEIIISGGGQISGVTLAEGRGGSVQVFADEISIDGHGSPDPTGIFASTLSMTSRAGRGGRIAVDAQRLEILSSGQIASVTSGRGDAGRVAIHAGQMLIDGGGADPSELFTGVSSGTNAGSHGDARPVQVTVDHTLDLRTGGQIDSSTLGAGNAGRVRVLADRLLMTSGAGITSDTDVGSRGDAGAIQVTADQVTIRDSRIGSRTFSAGDAGRVTIAADSLTLVEGGQISSSAVAEGTGPGGEVHVIATDTLLIAGQDADGFPSGIFATVEGLASAEEDAGNVTVSAGVLEIGESGTISSSTFSAGDAGRVAVAADRMTLLDGGQISSSALGESVGAGGEVSIASNDTLLIAGRDADGFSSGIFATVEGLTSAEEDAGNVTVSAGVLEIREGGQINSSTRSAGDAGRVQVFADELTVSGDSYINSSTFAAGDAGNVTVTANRVTLLGGGEIISIAEEAGTGAGGEVRVVASDRLLIAGEGRFPSGIFASVEGERLSEEDAGNVRVRAGELEIREGGVISSSALSEGNAGTLRIVADRLLIDDAQITSSSDAAGGGEIKLVAREVIDLHEGAITTSVGGGEDPTAGNITIDSDVLVIDSSQIQANAPEGFGGRVTIDADNVVVVQGGDFDSLLERGDISATGGTSERAGTIAVDAAELNLAGDLVVLQAPLLDAASQLRAPCGARQDVGASSFTAAGRGGLPGGPNAPLGSSYGAQGSSAPVAGGPVLQLAGCAGVGDAFPG